MSKRKPIKFNQGDLVRFVDISGHVAADGYTSGCVRGPTLKRAIGLIGQIISVSKYAKYKYEVQFEIPYKDPKRKGQTYTASWRFLESELELVFTK